MSDKISIHWFRQDLRISDNPSLIKALNHGRVLPIYIFDDVNAGRYLTGSASCWWLYQSLISLNHSLNHNLSVYRGDPLDILKDLIKRFDVDAIYWNRCYEPWQINRDTKIKEDLKNHEIKVESSNSLLLWEPWQIKNAEGLPYKVFTPFYRKGCLQAESPRQPLPAPNNLQLINDQYTDGIKSLGLLSQIPWAEKFQSHWNVSEKAALKCLDNFISNSLHQYKNGRDIPSVNHTSQLSPYLHFGEISPHQVWDALQSIEHNTNTDTFCSQLGWREFSYHLLYHHPKIPEKNLRPKFDTFPWVDDTSWLKAWQAGQTGVPMVDAGMRQLWQTGYMHNRVRMIVASFLVKNLRIHWHHGERWFWDTLLDADLANNAASWQWVAGCGTDAAPYFRIFNPVTQGKKFDPNGDYIRQFIPEIAKLPDKYIFSPWEAPKDILMQAEINLGKNYPLPIVDIKISRELALQAFQSLS